MSSKIVVAEDEPITRMDICEILISYGYDVVGEASDGLQAIDLCRKFKPDLVLMDIKMPKLDGMQAAKHIINENLVQSVIILTAYSGKEFIDKVKELGVLGYIVKPIDEIKLIPQIEIAIAKGKEINDRIKEFEQEIKNTKLIYKAKEILMEKYTLTENDAYKKLRKLSMDRQWSIVKTSKNLINYYNDVKEE
jgi:Response regulator with putative antiterminator output domain